MLTREELHHLAAQLLGVPQAKQYVLEDEDERIACFQDGGNSPRLRREDYGKLGYYNRFCLIDAETSKGVVYHMDADMETYSRVARVDFYFGLQSQKYRLELFDIRDWDKARLLFYGLRLPVDSVEGVQLQLSEPVTWLDWLEGDIAALQKHYEQQGLVAFNDVDVNGYYQLLVGARYFGYLNFNLFPYDEATRTVGEMIVPDDGWESDIQFRYGDEEDGEEEFWDLVRYGRVQPR